MALAQHILPYEDRHFTGVKALWEACFPDDPAWSRAEVAIPAKLHVQRNLFFVAVSGDRVIGTVMAGYDGHRGWLHKVAVDPGHQRQGIGEALVRQAERALAAAGCTKLNLQVRADNHQVEAFYHKIGYKTEARISMGKRLTG